MIVLWQGEVTSTLNICLNTEGEFWDLPVVEIQLRQKWVESIHICTNVAENYVLAFSVNLAHIKHGSWNQFSSTSRLLSSHHFLLIHSTQCKEQKLNKAVYTLGFSRESGKKMHFSLLSACILVIFYFKELTHATGYVQSRLTG